MKINKAVVAGAAGIALLAITAYKGIQKADRNSTLTRGAIAYGVSEAGYETSNSLQTVNQIVRADNNISLNDIAEHGIKSKSLQRDVNAYINNLKHAPDYLEAAEFTANYLKKGPITDQGEFHEALEKAVGREFAPIEVMGVQDVHQRFKDWGTDKYMDKVREDFKDGVYTIHLKPGESSMHLKL